jgi:DNA-binding transcriptional ArsR family regulator
MWEASIRQVLMFAVAGSRGGNTRALIIHEIEKKPSNANQLSKSLKLDYKTIQHHIKVLEENKIISTINKGKYGAVYILSSEMEKEIDEFHKIWERFGNK